MTLLKGILLLGFYHLRKDQLSQMLDLRLFSSGEARIKLLLTKALFCVVVSTILFLDHRYRLQNYVDFLVRLRDSYK